MMRIHLLRGVAVAALTSSLFGQALLLRDAQPVGVTVSPPSLANVIAKVVAGPDAAEAAAGLRTAIPAGTVLVGASRTGDTTTITLSNRFLLIIRDAFELELALEQINKSVYNTDLTISAVYVRIETGEGVVESLESLLERAYPPAALPATAEPEVDFTGSGPGIPGALSGRTIGISPGHGYYWHSTLGWTTQRGNIGGLIEDIHTNEIAMRFLLPYLENMGAAVISCRERGEITSDRVADNDAGIPTYTETGGWSLSGSSGYNGGTYKFATTGATATATATWTVQVVQDGIHPVYAWFRASSNRPADARYRIHHSGGVEEVSVDQTRDNLTWVFLGAYHFTAADGARIVLTNESTDVGKAVIADTVRVGGGVGSIARGSSGTSGEARWRECSRYWAQFNGAPSSVWNSSSGANDNSDDVTCRPRFIEWRGADAFVSLHTNAGGTPNSGARGTSTHIYNGGATAGSTTLQDRVHDQIIADVRAEYDPTWVDRGQKLDNFGEVRLLSSMPGVLIELAFHDTDNSPDHDALHDPRFRRIGGRAIARGIMRYFDATTPFPPEPPTTMTVTQDGAAGLQVSWVAVAGADRYTIEQSENGKGFTEVGSTTGTSWSTGPLPFGSTLSFRVRAWNAGGRSFPSEVLTAGTSHRPVAELLLVQGFDRLGQAVKSPENTFDYLALHADAIRRNGEFSIAFDATTNDAVRNGFVSLLAYDIVDWACGEESTEHETFDFFEQLRVSQFLDLGGRLLVTGAEIGWDLVARGNAGDATFYQQRLGASYVADDAATYGFRGRAGGIFAGIPTATFDNGAQGTYDVDWPDVIAPADASSTLCLEYATGSGAGIQRIVGNSRVVMLGFPLETIVNADVRADVMTAALRFLLDGRALEVPATVGLGQLAPFSVHLPSSAGDLYALAASLGTGPIPLAGGQFLPLDPDGLFAVTIAQPNAVFPGFAGTLDPQGRAIAGFMPPVQPEIVGMQLFISGLVIETSPTFAFEAAMPWYRIEIR